MGYYLGQFYFDKKELFLFLTLGLLIGAILLNYQIPFFRLPQLFVLGLFLLFTKAMIPSSKDTAVYPAFLSAFFLTLFLPFFTVILFLFISLLIFKLTKLI